MAEITNIDVIKAWATVPQEIIENFGEEGDVTRKHLLNPAIFSGAWRCDLPPVWWFSVIFRAKGTSANNLTKQ